VDLQSVHGTFVNGQKLSPYEPLALVDRNVITFGLSPRTYILRVFPKISQISANILDEGSEMDTRTKVYTRLNCMMSYRTSPYWGQQYCGSSPSNLLSRRRPTLPAIPNQAGTENDSGNSVKTIVEAMTKNSEMQPPSSFSFPDFMEALQSGQLVKTGSPPALECQEGSSAETSTSDLGELIIPKPLDMGRRVSFSSSDPEIIPNDPDSFSRKRSLSSGSLSAPRDVTSTSPSQRLDLVDDETLNNNNKRHCSGARYLTL